MKHALYFNDSYVKEWPATVEAVTDKYVILDGTHFYPNGGGQPNDLGTITKGDETYNIIFVRKADGQISHEVDREGLSKGDKVMCRIDWERRYKLMRMHTAAHIVDAVLYQKAGALCTGNQLNVDKSRIDFSLEEFDKEKMIEYINLSDQIAKGGINLKIYTLPREEALKIPGIVKLASVMPPNVSELRIVEIPGVDIQADGGTQVKNTSEIGNIKFLSVENKGKSNRRLYYTVE